MTFQRFKINLYERLFNKTVLLVPGPRGFEVVNISGKIDAGLYLEDGDGVHIEPRYTYPVHGIRGIRNICIKQFYSSELQNLYFKTVTDQPVMSEKILGHMLEMAELEGKKQSAGDDKVAKMIKYAMIFSAVGMTLALLIYLKMIAVTGGGA